MTISIGCDHAGVTLKEKAIAYLQQLGHSVLNRGTDTHDSVDYPDYAHLVAEDVETETAALGILICGSANGVCMTANKHKNIRAALCWKEEIAALARQHNNANIICLPARFINTDEALNCITVFINTDFEGGRHAARVAKISC